VSAASEDENYSDEELGLLERQLGDAAASEANLKSDWECALDAQQELLRSMAGHNASVSHARTALEEAQARLGEDVEQRLAQIEVEIEKACETLRRAEESEAALKATAPDMEMLEADLSRLVSAKENLQRQKQEMQSRIHQLDGLIGARADDGVEERYHTVSGQIDRLEQRDARYALEVRSLFELRSALEVARREARDVYFEPIKAELGPLLSVLHTNAQIEMDSDTMLPSRLLRGEWKTVSKH
jgi:chromosome segregation ATPase